MKQSQHNENQRLDIKIKMLEGQYRADREGGGHKGKANKDMLYWRTELTVGDDDEHEIGGIKLDGCNETFKKK